MPHTLAKELKDAGFPQTSMTYWKHLTESESGPIYRWVIANEGGRPPYQSTNFVAIPTLEELLKETQPDYISKEGKEIVAVKTGLMGSPTRHGRGSDWDIAVARLWLALNKQSV